MHLQRRCFRLCHCIKLELAASSAARFTIPVLLRHKQIGHDPLQTLREKPEWVKERLALKHFPDLQLVDEIVSIDESRRKLQQELDQVLNQSNLVAKSMVV